MIHFFYLEILLVILCSSVCVPTWPVAVPVCSLSLPHLSAHAAYHCAIRSVALLCLVVHLLSWNFHGCRLRPAVCGHVCPPVRHLQARGGCSVMRLLLSVLSARPPARLTSSSTGRTTVRAASCSRS
jgi:hypothetical protein